MSTIFSKIIAGEIPCHKIYEDDRVLAFLDINPNNEGHTLVIPKEPVEFLWDMDDEEYNYLLKITKKLALHLRRTLLTQYVGMQVVGEAVPHAHIHLIPFDRFTQFNNHDGGRAKDADLAKLADKLRIDQL